MSKRKSQNQDSPTTKRTRTANATEEEDFPFVDIFQLKSKTEELLKTLDEDSFKKLEEYTKSCIKHDKALNLKKHKFSTTLLDTVFKFLIANQTSESDTAKLVGIINLLRIETIEANILIALVELFVENLIRTNKLNESIGTVVSSIGQYLDTTKYSKNMDVLLKRVLNECKLDESLLIDLLKMITQMRAYNLRDVAELLIEKLFSEEQAAPEHEQQASKPKYGSNIKWKAENLEPLVHHSIVLISTHTNMKRAFVYEHIMKIFMDINHQSTDYLKDKEVYKKAEREALVNFKNEFSVDKSGFVSNEYLRAMNAIMDKYSIQALLNRFYFALHISITSSMQAPARKNLNARFMSLLRDYFEQIIKKKKNAWLKNCFERNTTLKNINNMFKYHRLLPVLSCEDIISGLVDFCAQILDSFGVETNEHKKQAYSLNEHMTQLATSVVEDLIKDCRSSKEKIISKFLDRALQSEKQAVYIDQLDIVFNSKLLKRLFFDDLNSTELQDLNRIIVGKLVGAKSSKKASSKVKNILQLNSSQNALKLLKAIRLFVYSSSKHHKNSFEDLLNLLKANVDSSDEEVKKTSLCGLLCLLDSLNRNHSPNSQEGTFYQRNRMRALHSNYKHSKIIFDQFKSMHAKNELNQFYKSCFYQSLTNLISNKSFIFETVNFLLTQLENLVIKNENQQAYFNLDKCIPHNEIKINEPVDVLFNCSIVVISKLKEPIPNSTPEANEQIAKLKRLINQISETYLKNDAKWLFAQYKSQLDAKIKQLSSPAASMKIVQQLQLGIIDSLMEHLIQTEAFSSIPVLLQRHEATSSLISLELEDLIRDNKLKLASSATAKRKLATDANKGHPIAAGLKKLKTHLNCSTQTEPNIDDDEDKENRSQKTTAKTYSTRKPLERIDNKQTLKKALSENPQTSKAKLNQEVIDQLRTLRAQSFANISFDYTPIVSYKTCLKLVQLFFSTQNSGVVSSELVNEPPKFQALVKLLIDDKLLNYLTNVVDKKLSPLLTSEAEFYDPESLTNDELFEFLTSLWASFSLRINGSEIQNGSKVFNSSLAQRISTPYLSKTVRLITFCQSIWTIVENKFQDKKESLLKSEKINLDSDTLDLFDMKDDKPVKKSLIFWKLIVNCVLTVKNHLEPSQINHLIASKCCASMLNLIKQILESVQLEQENYSNLYSWLFELANAQISGETAITEAVINLLSHVTNKLDSPVLFLKYLALEHYNYVYTENAEMNLRNRNAIEAQMQFDMLKQTNLASVQRLISSQIIDSLEEFKWALESHHLFRPLKLMAMICKQLESIVFTLNYSIKAISNTETSDIVLKSISKFYDFMVLFVKSEFVAKLDETGLRILKSLIDLMHKFFQGSNISADFNRIQEFRTPNEDEKIDTKEMISILNNKQTFENCIEKIDIFDKELERFNTKEACKMIKLMENYKTFIRSSLVLSSEHKITRTISASLLDKIINDEVMLNESDDI